MGRESNAHSACSMLLRMRMLLHDRRNSGNKIANLELFTECHWSWMFPKLIHVTMGGY